MSVNIRVYPVTVFIFLAAVSYVSINSVYAADYEKSQTVVQTNECGNYWFPLNVLCSNLGSQTQGNENSVSVVSAQEQEEDKSSKAIYGPPFP
jgi:uncharacterized OB-fold protein